MALDASKTATSVGDYDLIEQIAEGGMGTVHRAKHRITGQIVAIKMVPPHMLTNKILLQRFKNEFDAASKLDHPNIVRALEYGNVDGRPFLVMEFVEGESLGQRLERETKMPEADAIRIISVAAKGLQHAHESGMIHRDVKPDNIMVTPDGQVKLADLGLVKEVEADLNLTRTGRGLGTPHFMAPEQFRNAKNADIRCDIYSLGATLYMMVTGDLPFKSCGPLDAWMKKVHNDLPPPKKVNPKVSDTLDQAIRRSMDPDPAKRPGSCSEFVDDLTKGPAKAAAPATPAADPSTVAKDLWYLVYKDEFGTTHTVKGSTAVIRRSLQEGLLGDASNVRASRTKTGVFEQLMSYPEFRDLVLKSDSVSGLRKSSVGAPVPTAAPAGPAPNTNTPIIPPDHTSQAALQEWLTYALYVVLALGTSIIAFKLLFN